MIIDDIALTMHPEVGPRTAIHLLECFGSAERIFAATEQELIDFVKQGLSRLHLLLRLCLTLWLL